MLRTKINVNLGVSRDCKDYDIEMQKVMSAVNMEMCIRDRYHAAKSRAEADWLVGINATRALTCKYNAQLSCGRVQTPTLAMIARREEEIRAFKSCV